ncbi:MAG: adenylate/guanylate cyclase domain-containing protein [Deltaproteobacteria bacterium]|nr:adenylate/guanylate cyclase domain-containing protein [Deltaproteobacteria bacterium]
MLENGLEAWSGAGFPTAPIDPEALPHRTERSPESADSSNANSANAHTHAFLPGLVENYANRHELPIRRELAVLFVDIADSTPAILGASPEEALQFVQRFMGIVTEAALSYCGDVKDYEGDGALLYFESVAEATQAALAIREALAAAATGKLPPLRARLALDVGDIVIGVIGTAMRRSVALIGPSINLAARLLKQIPPDGIIATEAVVGRLRAEVPALAERFSLLDEKLELKGFDKQYVEAYAIR